MAVQNRTTVTILCDVRGCDERETFEVRDARIIQPVPQEAQNSCWVEVRHLGQPPSLESRYMCPKHAFELLGIRRLGVDPGTVPDSL